MKINKQILLSNLQTETTENISIISGIVQQHNDAINIQPEMGLWSVVQVIEHLNTYSNYYLPVIENALKTSAKSNEPHFKPGLLGNWFVNMMQPNNGVIQKKYKAAQKHLPQQELNIDEVTSTYMAGQVRLLSLLGTAAEYDLNSIRIPVSIAPLIKIKLGDAFRFLVAHQQRHLLQIEHIIQNINKKQESVRY